jgi:DNA polymerase elongation subunit (family B)
VALLETIQYTNCAIWGGSVLLRGVDLHTHQRIQQKVKFAPTLFRKSNNGTKTSLSGQSVEPIKFDSITDFKAYVKQYANVVGREIYGNTSALQQYMSGLSNNSDLSLIVKATIDIETTVETNTGMPSIDNPVESILLISIAFSNRSDIITLGTSPYKGNSIPNVVYKHCKDEHTLLKEFLSIWKSNYPDVVTGWNSDGFDIPYIYGRMCRILDEETAAQLSPWGNVFIDKKHDSSLPTTITMVGISQIDMMKLYKKYMPGSRASYSLKSIGEYEELEIRKLNFDDLQGGFADIYKNHWDRFVEYNVYDVLVVNEINKKLNLIDLHLMVAYEAHSNFEDAFSPVRTWESMIYHNCVENDIVLDPKSHSNIRDYEGAYVSEPKPGLYQWVSCIDATALYPSIMMSLNISPETYIGKVDTSVDRMLAGEYLVVPDDKCLSASGAVFDKTKPGLVVTMIKSLFDKRKTAKTQMNALKSELEVLKDRISELKAKH